VTAPQRERVKCRKCDRMTKPPNTTGMCSACFLGVTITYHCLGCGVKLKPSNPIQARSRVFCCRKCVHGLGRELRELVDGLGGGKPEVFGAHLIQQN
jgi:hypothetical protein